MPILREILQWSTGLPAWQSDAISRLFTNESLSEADLNDLFALLKEEHGIPDPNGRKAKRLSEDQISVPAAAGAQIKLEAIKNLHHVNNIAEHQRLPFQPNGLTVIYGDNGSGKSGYSRVLKRACRARDQKEHIHPNAFLPLEATGTPEALFEVNINGTPEELSWKADDAAPECLSSLAVFDSRCARSYLDEEGDFAYVPYGLDILEGLAGACKKLKEMIELEQALYVPDTTPFADLAAGDTAVGKLLAGLTAKTKLEQVEKLATLTAEEQSQHQEIDRQLKEANPKDKARQLQLLASRIGKVVQNLEQKPIIVDDAAVAKLRGLVEDYAAAEQAATMAAGILRDDSSLLPGTGGEAWKELFQAARKFAAEAYPTQKFPDLGVGSPCLLCQQPLADGAARLLRFEEFVQQEAEKTAKARKQAMSEAQTAFNTQNVSLGMDSELCTEIEALDKPLAESLRGFEAALLTRHTAVKTAIMLGDWTTIPSLLANPAEKLKALSEKIGVEAEKYEKLANEEARAALQKQYNELDARIRLAKVKASVLTAIERMVRQDKLKKCLSAVKPNAISLKATELAEKVVSKELETLLNEEFKALGAGNLQLILATRTQKGKTLHKLKLDFPQTKTPGDILSEGEQRAIALGAFLSEVKIGGSTGGIIFDDPVSSLDHKRREKVARRLVREAAARQVIIFTHDLYFLNLLILEAQKAGIPIETQSVSRKPEGFGVTDPDIPFEGMTTKARVGFLRNQHQKIEKIFKSGDELEHRKLTAEAYQMLRIAWERAIEEVLLRNVVLRFRKGIETQRLAGVSVEDPDYEKVNVSMTKCSNYAHDQALLGGVEVPEPDELLADINSLDEWRKVIEDRGVQVAKRRKTSAKT
jgi:energy-coupling factor transporter ATP-binding protein EcfA2